ncbi:hypothetical protein Tco_1063103 [Tanacetum coccineum]
MPGLTKDHEGNKPIRRIQKKAIRRIENIVCEDSGRYQTWSLLQKTLIRRIQSLGYAVSRPPPDSKEEQKRLCKAIHSIGDTSGYQQKDRKPSQNDKTEHGMEKTVQNKATRSNNDKSESI